MFSSAVLDLAIGVVFCFLTVGLATGAIVEAIASFLKLRSTTLRSGIGQLLNDTEFTGLAKEIYAHAAVNPRSDGTHTLAVSNRGPKIWPITGLTKIWSISKTEDPAYIDRQLFGQAMLDVLKISPEIWRALNNPNAPRGKPTEADLKAAVNGALAAAAMNQGKTDRSGAGVPDEQLQKLLHGIIERSLGDPDKIKQELVAWFDNAMDRVSGWYKRYTQAISFFVALALVVGLNIDTVNVAHTLWKQPKLAEDLTKGIGGGAPNVAQPAAMVTAVNGQQTGASDPATADVDNNQVTSANKETPAQMLYRLDTTLPIGWPLSPDEPFGIAIVGWLITALSALFGAPFWFDLLQSFVRLKGAGPSPLEKVDNKGAAA